MIVVSDTTPLTACKVLEDILVRNITRCCLIS